jgi:hypothetical protein
VLGQLRGRNLPVPAAKFAEQLARVLEAMRPEPGRTVQRPQVSPIAQLDGNATRPGSVADRPFGTRN